jgi:transposase
VIHRHYPVHADALLTEPDPPVAPGIDETRRGAPKWVQDTATSRWAQTERFENQLHRRLRARQAARPGRRTHRQDRHRLAGCPRPGVEEPVRSVAIDPCAIYRSAVERALPHAVIVVDHFHLVRLANQAVTRVRQRVTRQVLGRRGTSRGPAWANRRRLLRARERLTTEQFHRMWEEDDHSAGARVTSPSTSKSQKVVHGHLDSHKGP